MGCSFIEMANLGFDGMRHGVPNLQELLASASELIRCGGELPLTANAATPSNRGGQEETADFLPT